MKKTLLLTVFAAILSTLSAQAQQVRTITLQEAIDLALENNFALKQAENNLGLSEKNEINEMADFLPSVSAGMGGSINKGTQQTFENGILGFRDVTSKGINGNIGASMQIFNGFDNILTLKQSKIATETSQERLQRAREQVIFQAAYRFLGVVLAQELLTISEENLASSEAQLEQIRAQVEVGSRPLVDQYNQESVVANSELTVTQRENALTNSKLSLIRHLQLDPTVDYDLITPQIDESFVSGANPQAYNLEELIDQALANRADFRVSLLEIQNLEISLQRSKFNLLPSIDGSARVTTGYSDQYSAGGQSVGFGDQFFDQRINKSLGLNLNFPIFQRWDRVFQIQSSQVNLKNAELALDDSRLAIVEEVTLAYTDYIANEKAFQAIKKVLLASEKAYETQQERYNVGASTLIELTQAQATYIEAQSNYARDLYNLAFQEKVLEFTLGKLNIENIEF